MSNKEKLERNYFAVEKEILKPGEIPSIMVVENNLPEAWETAVLTTWELGTRIPTEYDQDIDPESKDVTMMITVASPFSEPRIHKDLPCGLDDLAIYTQEVIDGIHDDRVKKEGWSYSYHDRLFNWPGIGSWRSMKELVGREVDFPFVNQIGVLVDKLASVPYSRRAQAITWNPLIDIVHHEPPCLQRVWCRVVRSKGNLYLLEMNTHWRSRDALKASFMNMFALTELQRRIAKEITEVSGHRVEVGRYVDISDSFHIYGSYVRRGEIDSFLQRIDKLSFERRTFRSDDSIVQAEFRMGRKRLVEERRTNGKES